ncbi:LysM peptidoglycan-binding domain-containing protein [Croceivirga thetidis]|uniref:LysM peptidoglycan-binding domain-containing protein n=1 Tax=Croceivirga thetidis TaxID=2721623 RepID=A0ABX1GNJ4_9FLAO|nr:LysM peptidoglycan-binding domain-containing protein [Croceivirga thetidis]NKI31214.1 LysM peptidoglycan-binding domain-containing protein [Croceivirga thetidis]
MLNKGFLLPLAFLCAFCLEGYSQKADSTAAIIQESTPINLQPNSVFGEKELFKNPAKEATLSQENSEGILKDLEKAYAYDSLWLREISRNEVRYQDLLSDISEEKVLSEEIPELNSDTLKMRLARINEKTPFNVSYNPHLESVIKYYLKRRRPLIENMLTASQFYFPLFEQELDNKDLPLELKYLAIVESALSARAKSPVGATGLWQFMFATGKAYGLDVSSYVDERSDPIFATKAAGEYLNSLYSIYKDWDLALAAYNSGPGNVNKAIRRSGGYRNFWNIRMFLPRETAGYVPAFLATMYLFEYAEEHGLKGKNLERPYFETDTVLVKQTITFDQISKLVGISVEELEVLNPAYKLNIIPKDNDKKYALRLPLKHMGKFVTNEKAIYDFAVKQLDSLEKPLPELVKAQNKVRYRVRNGDYLGKIAERYGVGVSQIRRWNGLRGDNLRIGQRLTIYPRKPVSSNSKSQSNTSNKETVVYQKPISLPSDPSKIHIVESGDSLWTISQKYPGITIENLRKWNGLNSTKLKPGTKLRLCDCSS